MVDCDRQYSAPDRLVRDIVSDEIRSGKGKGPVGYRIVEKAGFVSMTQEELYSHPGWQWCTPEGSELHTLLLGLQLPFREKLKWLEEAENLTILLRRARERKKKNTSENRPHSKSL